MSPEFQPLVNLLANHFDLNLARIKCLSQLVLSMIKLQTVNLADICNGFNGVSKPASSYKRLQRFIREVFIPQKALAQFIVAIKGLDKEKSWKLSMDRTNWKIGRIHINILCLAVCYKNVAIPLFLLSKG